MSDSKSLAWLGGDDVEIAEFEPMAQYFVGMDYLLYITEDCSYRADRIDGWLTLLRHPAEDRLVGIKLKGFEFIFRQLQAALKAAGSELDDGVFTPMVAVLEVAMVGGLGSEIVNTFERKRIEDAYCQAKHFAQDHQVPISGSVLEEFAAA